MKALLAASLWVAGAAAIFACADQTVDPEPARADAGPGSSAPASNCSSRCAAISVSCGSDPAECASLCVAITEGELSCIEDSDCSASAAAGCTNDAGVAPDAGDASSSGGECTPLSSACRSAAECCGGGSCTNKIGASDMVCCESAGSTCAADQDCCTTHCSAGGKCCNPSALPCTTDTAATCCSGVCDSSGFCAP